MNKVYYFAYGSNMSQNRMKEREINFHSRKFAILENHKIIFNKQSKSNINISFANIAESLNSKVEGVLYLLDVEDIKILDKFEGYPKHYNKKIMNVLCDGVYIECVVYIANKNMINNNALPTQKYMNYILDGKDLLSDKYFDMLKEHKIHTN